MNLKTEYVKPYIFSSQHVNIKVNIKEWNKAKYTYVSWYNLVKYYGNKIELNLDERCNANSSKVTGS